MAKIYYDADADLGLLKGKKIAVLGYGSQGHAHSLNLKESGLDVIVAENNPAAVADAKANGLTVMSADEAAQKADVIMMLLPDNIQREVYYKDVEKNLRAGKTLMFAHGFNIHYSQIVPPSDVDVSMIAPKAPGHRMREVFKEGIGVPALVAVYQDASGKAKENALAYAKGIGSTRAGVLETTFAEETETDLFGEQCVLCGGATALVKAGFETLVAAGYQPEIAYFECLHELKLIVDLMYEGGMARMRYSISDTAEWGDYVWGPRVIGPESRAAMKQALDEIQNGTFATNWLLENQAGRASFNARRRQEANHLIEVVGGKLRAMMPWLKRK